MTNPALFDMPHPLVHEFMALFEGHQTSYGTYTLTGEITEAGKHKGKAVSINRQVTVECYSDHLTGKKGLGIIPINASSMAKFGAIDIDQYPLEIEALHFKIIKLKLPLILCRTKSGGAHLYLFLKDWAPAALVQKKLREMAVCLGYGTCEIYPRQSQLLAARGDAGNWINLPYFEAHRSFRYALHITKGTALGLQDFITRAFEMQITAADLLKLSFKAPEALPGGPPCLQTLVQQGFPDGTRNQGLMNLGVFAQKCYADRWESVVEEYNRLYMKPPLQTDEVLNIIKSLKRKQYSYTCKSQPIQPYCNAAVCRTCVHGVGGAELGMPKFGTLTKLNTVPAIWFLDVEQEEGTGRLELTTEELQNPLYFQRKCMEMLNLMPVIHKREVWSSVVCKLLQDVNIVDVSYEATPAGQLMRHLEVFLIDRKVEAKTCDELLLGKPWVNNNEIHFRLGDFIDYLQMKKFNLLPLGKIASVLKDVKGFRRDFHHIKGKGVNVVIVPADTFTKQNRGLDTPDQPTEIL